MTSCLVNGCFDSLHPGHLFILGFAAAQGDRLVVGINSDRYIREHKGREPWFNEAERALALYRLPLVYRVLVFEDDPSELVYTYRPEVYCVGEEYRETYLARVACQDTGTRVVFVPRVGNWASRLGPTGESQNG